MTTGELLAKVWKRLDQVTDVDSTSDYWTAEELIDDYANEARTDLFRIVKWFQIDSTTALDGTNGAPLATIPIVANTALYHVSSKILQTTRFQLASMFVPLSPMTQSQLDAQVTNWRKLPVGTPFAYCTDYQTDCILLVPPPIANDTASLTNSIYPLTDLSASIPDAPLGFRSEYHKDLIPKILSLALSKRDIEVNNPDLAGEFEAKFVKRADEIALEMYRRTYGQHTNRCSAAYTP
jgi:hypothetical protein